MRRRTLLERIVGAGAVGLAGCVGTAAEDARPTPDLFMSFAATHPADRPLVAGGLTAVSDADRYGHLLTARPATPVFTGRIEDESPYMRSQVRKDAYDSRFLVVAQLRADAPFTLEPAVPGQVRWEGPDALSVAAEASPYDDPPADLSAASSVVSTALFIFEHGGTRPKTVTLRIGWPNGGPSGAIVASSA